MLDLQAVRLGGRVETTSREPGKASEPGSEARLLAAFADEEYRGLQLATRARLVTLAVIAVWIPFENHFPEVLYYYGLIVGIAVLGVAPLALRRAGRDAPWVHYVFPFLDISFFTLAVLIPNPLEHDALSAPMRLRMGNEVYLFLLVAAPVLTYSPRVVLWTGLVAAAAWSVGMLWIASLPGSITVVPREQWANMPAEQIQAVVLNPHLVNLGFMGRLVVLLLVVAGVLATAVWRSRRLVLRQVAAERERANLSRYFSPNMVDELAQSDEPLRVTRTQNVAVLFADIVGFTTYSASQAPQAVILLLREFHGLLARAVFAHDGTLDKYLGDGVMATFGTPRTSGRDATNALRCARAMVRQIAAWNAGRAVQGAPPIPIAIGVHYGPVVLGDIGDAQHLEFAVLGDTVNVASRLEELTRTVGAVLLVSDDLMRTAQAEGTVEAADLDGLVRLPPQPIRGRQGGFEVWALQREKT